MIKLNDLECTQVILFHNLNGPTPRYLQGLLKAGIPSGADGVASSVGVLQLIQGVDGLFESRDG